MDLSRIKNWLAQSKSPSPDFRNSPAWDAKKTAPRIKTGKSGWGEVKSRKGLWGNTVGVSQNDKYYSTSKSSQNPGVSRKGSYGNNLPRKK